ESSATISRKTKVVGLPKSNGGDTMEKPTRRLTQSRPIGGSSMMSRLVLSLAAMAFSATTASAQTVVAIDNNLSTGLKRYNPRPTNAWTPHGDAWMFTRGVGPTFGDTLFTTANDNWGARNEYAPNGRNVSLFTFGNPSSS